MSRIQRWPGIFGLVVVLLGAGTVPATAAPANITCLTGTNTVVYTPGITIEPVEQHISVDFAYHNCLSLTAPAVHHGSASGSTRAVQSCLTPARVEPVRLVITWRDARDGIVGHSDVSATRVVTDVAAGVLVEFAGTVTAGLGKGSPFLEQVTFATLTAHDCLANGVQRRDSLSNITKIGLLA